MACAYLSDNFIPEYVNYLMSPDTPLDFHINVGFTHGTKKTFGVDKWMLGARSKVLRKMLHESPLKHDKEFDITDLDPCTFQHFLVYIYGVDNTAHLTFNDSVDLLSAAEKYDVADLKTKLGKIITPQVDSSNVFVVLKNALVCERVPELWEATTKVIQYNTDELFSNNEFLEARKEVVLYIIQQDKLNIPEIEIWKNALKWARFQGQEELITPENLRRTLLPMLKHIRLCTLNANELVSEVFTTGILNAVEVQCISLSVAQKKKFEELTDICSDVEERSIVTSSNAGVFFESDQELGSFKSKISHVILTAKGFDLLLSSVEFLSNRRLGSDRPAHSYLSVGTITISCQSDLSVQPVKLDFVRQVAYDQVFVVKVAAQLKSSHRYKIAFAFLDNTRLFYKYLQIHHSDDFTLEFGSYVGSNVPEARRFYGSSFKRLNYKVLK